MVLKTAFKKSVSAIKKHKLLFLILFLFQLAFFVLIGAVNVKYQLQIGENLQSLILPLQDANYDEQAISSGVPFLEDTAKIFENYRLLLQNLQKLALFTLLIYLFLHMWNWTLTHHMFEKQKIVVKFSTLVLRSLVFIIPIALIVYLILRNAFSQVLADETFSPTASVYFVWGITIVGYYFMVISLGMPWSNLKDNLRKTFKLGVTKGHWILLALFIEVVAYGLAIAVLGEAAQNWPFFLMVLFVIVLVLVAVATRIFFVAVVREVEKQA